MAAKILVVDDDPDMRDALTIILESRGYTVVTAADGVEGMATLKAEKPDLMMLDLLMPKMDGFAVLKELQDERWAGCRHTPVMVLSSVGEKASRRRYELETGLNLAVADYMEKPVAPATMLERVGQLLKKAR